MRISDWSSDVCPSDLALRFDHQLELLVVEPHIEQSIRGIARADALLSGALMHGSARQRCYGAAQLLQQFAFLKLKNSHIRPPVNMSLISNIRRYSTIPCPVNFIETALCLGIAGNRRGIHRRLCFSVFLKPAFPRQRCPQE